MYGHISGVNRTAKLPLGDVLISSLFVNRAVKSLLDFFQDCADANDNHAHYGLVEVTFLCTFLHGTSRRGGKIDVDAINEP